MKWCKPVDLNHTIVFVEQNNIRGKNWVCIIYGGDKENRVIVGRTQMEEQNVERFNNINKLVKFKGVQEKHKRWPRNRVEINTHCINVFLI